MKKKIKSAVISIAVIAVLLLSILIGVKNGTLDKLTKEMPTLETKQEETKKSAENESQKNESSNSVRIRNSSRRDIANVGQQFELRNNDVKYTYDENNRETYNVFYITVKSVNISRQCDFDINRIDFGLSTKRDSMDNNDNFISDYYYMTVELEVTKDINDNEMFADDYNNLQTLWTSVKVNKDGTYNKIKDYEFHTLWHSVKLNEDGTYNKIENYENVGISSDNTHGNVHFEKGETKTITLYYLITDEEFENETLAIDFHYYGSPCKGTLAIVHEPEEN